MERYGTISFVVNVNADSIPRIANSEALIREKEELAVMAAMQKEGYEKILTELRAELERLKEKEIATSDARIALEEEMTQKAVLIEADWRSNDPFFLHLFNRYPNDAFLTPCRTL